MAFWILALALFAGAVSAKPQRIVGGEPTTIEKYPSIVQIQKTQWTGIWDLHCGGNILTARSVLSAANCFVRGRDYNPHFFRIMAGATYRNSGGQISYVDFTISHPSFDHTAGFDGDIAVVRLIEPLVYSPVIAQASIPPQGTTIPNDLPVVHAGWGRLRSGNPVASMLRDITLFTVDNTLCSEVYRQRQYDVTENMICARDLSFGNVIKDTCPGDNGGPMYYGNITVGIVAFNDCGETDSPAVSTAVSSYTNWISANTV